MTQPQDPEFLTVAELATLLRLKDRKIYDLAASGTVPCSRATGKLLFPAREVRAWLRRESTGWPEPAAPRPPILLGSHDPLLDWAIRESRCGLASFYDGSIDGLTRLAAREGVAAGVHLFDAPSQTWNLRAVQAHCPNAVILSFATRARGLVLAKGTHGIGGMRDLAGQTVVPRQPGSGSHGLFQTLAQEAGLDLTTVAFAPVARTESDAVQAVARGEAKATLGVAAVARDFGLDFVPLVQESFDLVVDRTSYFEPPLQTLLTFLRHPDFAQQAHRLGGYDVSRVAEVSWAGGG